MADLDVYVVGGRGTYAFVRVCVLVNAPERGGGVVSGWE